MNKRAYQTLEGSYMILLAAAKSKDQARLAREIKVAEQLVKEMTSKTWPFNDKPDWRYAVERFWFKARRTLLELRSQG